MSFYRFALLCIACLSVNSCTNHKAEIVLSQAATMLETQPETTASWLTSLDSSLFKSRRLRAEQSLLYLEALEKMGKDTNDLLVIAPAVQYYGHRKPFSKQARSWYYQGKVLTNAEAYPEALISLMRAREAATKTKDAKLLSQIAQATGDIYGKSFLYEDAMRQYQSAYSLAEGTNNAFQINTIRYAMARTFNNLKQYQQADSLFHILFNEGSPKMDPLTYTRFLADYALLKVNYTNDYPMAELLYGLALSRRRSFDSYNHWGAFAYTKARNGKTEQQKVLFKQLEQSGKDENYSVMVWKARTYALQSAYQEAFELLDRSIDKQADRAREVLRQSAIRAQRDFFEEEFRHSQKENNLIRLIIVLSVILLMVTSYIIYSKIHKKNEELRIHEMNILEAASSLSDQLGELQQERLLLKEQYIRIHQNQLKEFGSLLKTTLGVNETNIGAKQAMLYEKARKTMDMIVNDKKGNSVFEDQINSCFDNALTNLRVEIPNHTEEYYRFAGFVFAGFDNETLMAITGTKSLDSIYAKKKRLRQDIFRSNTEHRDQLLLLVK